MTSDLAPYGGPLVSFLVTYVALFLLLRICSRYILDHPGQRSLHHQPVPRTGGVGVMAGIAASIPLVSAGEWWPLWLGTSILVGLSFLDDLMGLSVGSRLLVHFAVAIGFVLWLLPSHYGVAWTVAAVMAVVWMINLYNFMDGMDGLAGGMAVVGFSFLAGAAALETDASLALVNASIATAAAAFLFFNFHPARIFLGDAGSTAFGFLAAALGMLGWRDGVWSMAFPVLVFSPFIVDSSVTLLRRIVQRKKFWQPHRTHCYQRLVLSGWGQRRTAYAEVALMICCGGTALLYESLPPIGRMIVLIVCAGVFGMLVKGVDRIEQLESEKLAQCSAKA